MFPKEGVPVSPYAAGIPKTAPHPNAARLFLEFLQSEEVARISVKTRADSLRPEVTPLPGAKSFSEVKTFQLAVAETQKGIPEVIEQWRDTFGT